jgi:hypothetical protein
VSDNRLAELEWRRKDNLGKQVDNARLPAGSNMYYYCHGCGVQTDVKPEGWWQDPPPKHCEDCKALVDEGLLDGSRSYDAWLREHDHRPVPR